MSLRCLLWPINHLWLLNPDQLLLFNKVYPKQWVSFLSFVNQSTFHGLHSSIFNSNQPIGALGRKIQARDKKGGIPDPALITKTFYPQ